MLHLRCGDRGRPGSAGEHLAPGPESWRQAALFVRMYRALHGLTGGDSVSMCHWLRVESGALGGAPLLVMVDEGRLAEVVRHVEQRLKAGRHDRFTDSH